MKEFWSGFTKRAYGSGAASGATYHRDHIKDRIDSIDEDSYFEADRRAPSMGNFRMSGSSDLTDDESVVELAEDRNPSIEAPKSTYLTADGGR